jgi:outer membrane murein-binding lipoprotein Lpp
MKKFASLLIAGAAVVLAAGCANIYKMNKAELNAVPVTDVKTNPAKWENVTKDIQAGKETVFFIGKGQSIPVKLNISCPFAKLAPGKNVIEFTQDTYLLISRTKMRISPDGESWVDIYDLQSLKALYGFQKGTLSLGLSASKEEGSQISVEISAQ